MSNKEKIILAALSLFAKHGYTETSIDKIAKHANVSKGLTYTHFKNKEELLAVTIQETITRMSSEMMNLDELSIESFFNFYFSSLIKNTEIIRLSLLLVIHPQTPSSVTSLLENQKEELLEFMSCLLQEQFKETSMSEAKLLLATIDGIVIEHCVNPNLENLNNILLYLKSKYVK